MYEYIIGTTPVRVFFHVDYKPNGSDSRKVGKEDMSTLEKQLELMGSRIKDISTEIEHARRQEIAMKESGGKTLCVVDMTSTVYNNILYLYVHCTVLLLYCRGDDA